MSIFARSFAALAATALAAILSMAAIGIAVMDRAFGEAAAEDLDQAALALASALPEELRDAIAAHSAAPALHSTAEAKPSAAEMLPSVSETQNWVARVAAASGYRITLVRADGAVLADSGADPAAMENHGSRPEIRAALAGSLGSARRSSETLGREFLYAAAPVYATAVPRGAATAEGAVAIPRGAATAEGTAAVPRGAATAEGAVAIPRGAATAEGAVAVPRGAATAALRLALEAPRIEGQLAGARWAMLALAAVLAAAAAGGAAALGRSLSRPLSSLADTAKAYGKGDLSRPPEPPSARAPEEIRVLARTLQLMAGDLAGRMGEAEARRGELEAVLDAMSEAVLALDRRLAIGLANPAAAALFGLASPTQAIGKSLLEATRSTELQAVAQGCLESRKERQTELCLFLPAERWFQALAAPLSNATSSAQSGAASEAGGAASGSPGGGPEGAVSGDPGGVVLVLNDITELRRLERVRRDFVANVSHELRTPVQLVKGFAEALRGGAMNQADTSDRFLAIIEKNAARMESLIADLLSLASLEREGRRWLEAETTPIAPVLAAAAEALEPKASAKGMRIELSCDQELSARINAGLLEQALVNLIDNAVKYSFEGGAVEVRARREGEDSYMIEVADRGMGIPARDLGRVFERFYRVDKARSRELGGTGLGLAIVRHIALAHGGSISVESWEGEGSTFSLKLPLAGPPE